MSTDQPWWSRTSTLVVGVLLFVALVGSGIVWITGDDDPPPPSTDGGPTSSAFPEPPAPTETSDSQCGLAAGDWAAASTPPDDARWVAGAGGLEAPTVPEAGPGTTNPTGVHECFARNPLGAVMAAMWVLADAENPNIDELDIVMTRLTGETADAAIGNLSGTDLGSDFLGFRFLEAPTRDRADIELLLLADGTTDGLLGMQLTFLWQEGDWRLDFPDTIELARPTSADSFTRWSSPGTASEATAVPGLNRPAPGWAGVALDDEEIIPDPPYSPREAEWAQGYEGSSAFFEREFAEKSHAERRDVMTPDPPLSAEDRAWLETSKGQYYSEHSMLLERYYNYTREERDNVNAGLEPDGDESGPQTVRDCDGRDLVDCAKDSASDLAGDGVDAVTGLPADLAASAFEGVAQNFVEAADWAVKTLLAAWLKYPDPNLPICYGGSQGCSTANTAAWMQSNLHYLLIVGMVAALMIGALRMAITGQFEHGRDAGVALVKAVVVMFAAGTIVVTSMEAADLWADWILDQAELNPSAEQFAIAGWASLTNPGVLIVLGLLVLITQLIQLALMVIRSAMVVILCGILPLAASMTNTQAGKQWFAKSVAWLVAWILYKPVAALVYAAAIKMASGGDEGTDIATQLSGIFLMILAVFTLPALMRFLVPAVAAASSGNAGAVAATMVGGGLAMGAAVATGGGSMAASGGFAGASAGGFGGGTTGGGAAGGVTKSPSGASPMGSGGGGGPSGGTGGGPGGSPPVVETPAGGQDQGSGAGQEVAAVVGADSGGPGGQVGGQADSGSPSATPGGASPAASAGTSSTSAGSSGGSSGGGPSGAPTSGPASSSGGGGGASGAGAAPPPPPSGGSGGGGGSAARNGPSSPIGPAAQTAASTANQVRQEAAGAVEKERQE